MGPLAYLSPSTSAKNIYEMIKRLEEDSANVLAYMASNGLVANATKTSLVILNMDKMFYWAIRQRFLIIQTFTILSKDTGTLR